MRRHDEEQVGPRPRELQDAIRGLVPDHHVAGGRHAVLEQVAGDVADERPAGRLQRLVLGSVTLDVLRRSPHPVLVVPSGVGDCA